MKLFSGLEGRSGPRDESRPACVESPSLTIRRRRRYFVHEAFVLPIVPQKAIGALS
jgi:hypothetical protein